MDAIPPTALAWISGGIAVPAAFLVFALIRLDRRWAAAVGLASVLALMALFAYTANVIITLYSTPGFSSSMENIVRGVEYQRVAAGQLAAASFIIGLLAIGYYIELGKR